MDTRKPIDTRASALMMLLCATWGMQQVAIKAASPDIAPILQIALRSGLAALIVAALMGLRRERLAIADGTWRPGLTVGVLFALEFLCVGEGLRYTSAAHMVIFLYTAPIFAAIGLHVLQPSERLGRIQWLGILLAFAGIVVAFHGPGGTQPADPRQHLGDALGLLGAIAWGLTTVTVRCTRLSHTPAAQTLLYQLLGACVLLALVAWASGQTDVRWSALTLASLGFQTLLVSVMSFLAWFWLLGRYLASRLGVLSFATPLFGVGFGVWLLDERLEATFGVGALLVLGGVLMVSGHDLLARRRSGTPGPAQSCRSGTRGPASSR